MIPDTCGGGPSQPSSPFPSVNCCVSLCPSALIPFYVSILGQRLVLVFLSSAILSWTQTFRLCMHTISASRCNEGLSSLMTLNDALSIWIQNPNILHRTNTRIYYDCSKRWKHPKRCTGLSTSTVCFVDYFSFRGQPITQPNNATE